MSKLEELIKEYCPDGVEYKPLSEVCLFRRGTSLTSKDAKPGNIPAVSGGQKPAFYHNEYNRTGTTITVAGSGAYAGFVNIWYEPIFCCDAFTVEPADESILDIKYLYHFLLNNQEKIYAKKTGAGIPHVHGKDLYKFQIPLPPLPVQREIVRILDNFSQLTAELNKQLTAELAARKKQYSFYRDWLINEIKDVKVRTLDEMCIISAGGDAPKDNMSINKTDNYTIPIISNGVGENAVYGYTDIARISEPAVTVAARGTIGYAEYRDYPYFPIIRLLTVIPRNTNELNPKYLFYCIQDRNYKVPTSGIPQLTAPMLKKEKILVPGMDVQTKIVSILDRFDALCNDLSSGLSAEIEARKKQYEYYRDKLLSFRPLKQ